MSAISEAQVKVLEQALKKLTAERDHYKALAEAAENWALSSIGDSEYYHGVYQQLKQ